MEELLGMVESMASRTERPVVGNRCVNCSNALLSSVFSAQRGIRVLGSCWSVRGWTRLGFGYRRWGRTLIAASPFVLIVKDLMDVWLGNMKILGETG